MATFRYYRSRTRNGATRPATQADAILRALSRRMLDRYDLAKAFDNLAWEGLIDIDEERVDGLSKMLNRVEEIRRSILDAYTVDHVLDDMVSDIEPAPPGDVNPLEELVTCVKNDACSLHDEHEPIIGRLCNLVRKLSGFDAVIQDPYRMDDERVVAALSSLSKLLGEERECFQGEVPIHSLDFWEVFVRSVEPRNLVERVQEERAAVRLLLASLPYGIRLVLERLMEAGGKNPLLPSWLPALWRNLDRLAPLPEVRTYRFTGHRRVDLGAALDLARKLRKLEVLERSLQRARFSGDLSLADGELLQELLGELAERSLESLKGLAATLVDHGYLVLEEGEYRLTSKAWKRIADLALLDILQGGKALGSAVVRADLPGAQTTGETKPYEYGDPFALSLCDTLMSALRRSVRPIRLSPADFVIHRRETPACSNTVLLIDMSSSMDEVFPEVRRLALAMHRLVQVYFPRDSLYMVGFYTLARELHWYDLRELSVRPFFIGQVPASLDYRALRQMDREDSQDWPSDFTNMQYAMRMARSILSRSPYGEKQMVMITDGEPTACVSDGTVHLAQCSSEHIVEETLKEAMRCRSAGIRLTLYLLSSREETRRFAEGMARKTGGTVVLPPQDELGGYVVRDYFRKTRSLRGNRGKHLLPSQVRG